MSARALLALAVASLSLACAAGRLEIAVRSAPTPSADQAVRLIAVFPPVLHFEAPAYRSFELATDEIQAILDTGRFLVLGPDEFNRINEHANASLYGSTNLSSKLSGLSVSPKAVVAMRTSVEQRAQRGTSERSDPNGLGHHRERSAELIYVVHAQLMSPDSPEPLAIGSLEVNVDPFADHPPSDDAPDLRQAVKRLTTELVARAEALLGAAPSSPFLRALPFEADWVPWNEEAFAMPGRPALARHLHELDAASSEAERLLRLSYFEPDLPPARQNAMLSQPPGLWIRSASGPWQQAGLQPDDLLMNVEGDPVAGPQTLLRWVNAKPSAPLHLTIRRGTGTEHLVVQAAGR